MGVVAPFFSLCYASDQVKALLGSSPMRVYPFGVQDDNVVYPYFVWQNVSGMPANYLNTRPNNDNFTIQVDGYSNDWTTLEPAIAAIRDAVEGDAYIVRWGDQTYDSETKVYRYSFDVEFYQAR